MLTPYGQACPYYYVDAHRRVTPHERCELLRGLDAGRWTSELCRDCSAPRIAAANRCPTMALHGRVSRRGWRFWQSPRMVLWATCPHSKRHDHRVADPMVGCGRCHGTLEFVVGDETSDLEAADSAPDDASKERTHE